MSETLHLPCWPQRFCWSTSIILPKKRDFLQSTTCHTGAMPFQSARCSLQLWDRFWGPLQMSRIWRKNFLNFFFCSESSVVRCSVSFRHGFSFWLSLFWQIQGIQPVWFFMMPCWPTWLSPNAWIPFLLKDLPGDTSEAASLLRLGSHSFYSLQNQVFRFRKPWRLHLSSLLFGGF